MLFQKILVELLDIFETVMCVVEKKKVKNHSTK